ncbi:MAG TPA: hypothetical protein P5121_39335 [Caldilineaceae bacterium]|nr:hypothetical protein [Caldilineaceae bacterium]
MQWQEIRRHFPTQWLLVEALEAHSTTRERVIEQMSVIDIFPDSSSAMKRYRQLHHNDPQREMYVLHSSREHLSIKERTWFGVRG